jgi:Protein of unknown function (DUF732)
VPTAQTTTHSTRSAVIALLIMLAVVVGVIVAVFAACSGPSTTDAENAYLVKAFDLHTTAVIPQDQLLAAGHLVCTDMLGDANGEALAKFHTMNTYGTDPAQANLVFTAATSTLCPASSAGAGLPGSTVDTNR